MTEDQAIHLLNLIGNEEWQYLNGADILTAHVQADVVLKNYVGERIALAYEAIESRIDGIQRIIDCIDTRLGGVVIPTTGRVQIDARILGLILTEREAMQQRIELLQAELTK